MILALRALGFAAVVLAIADPARGEIYRWTDAQGRIHFTEHFDRVPVDHRAAARAGASAGAPGRIHTYSGSAVDASSAPARGSRREIEIPFVRMGSLMRVDARVNDLVTVPFLIDTGASGVSIPHSYAAKLGIRVRPDTPHVQVTTANGVVARPLISLRSIEIAGARVENLSATIDPGLDFGLLGGSFFNHFVYRVDAARGVMTLAPNNRMRGGLDEAQWRERFRTLTDPPHRLEAYLRDHPYLEERERSVLTTRERELRTSLSDLERRAD
ncbi:MAG: retroviral-like aspartic protease family protein, partial [Myxococcota bacterium]